VLAELYAPPKAKLEQKIINAPVRIIAEGDYVVVKSRGRNMTKEGNAYNNSYCNVLRLEGGRLKEWTEYADSALVNAVLGDPRETLVEPVPGEIPANFAHPRRASNKVSKMHKLIHLKPAALRIPRRFEIQQWCDAIRRTSCRNHRRNSSAPKP
jgi:hypothetical protein